MQAEVRASSIKSAKMVVGKILRTTSCASCRLSILRSFTSVATPSIRSTQVLTRHPRFAPSSQFRHSSRLAQDPQELRNEEIIRQMQAEAEEAELEVEMGHDLEEEELEAEEVKEGGDVSTIPWYLQVDQPAREIQPLSERQKIPELPESSPPILEPLLQQISIDLGMDDLSLLDLRKLDPPPALGANLLMILGTARSEKHLHVSADRLCRWLRSNYKIRPDADGLLGRNELKLKLKRKAKRAKLMGNAETERDDGIRTGWVCVDMGIVEGGNVNAEAPRHKDFVGFGRRVDGVRIVVQLLTEEKREEIELEALWGGILRRGGQTDIPLDEEVGQELPAIVSSGGHRPQAQPRTSIESAYRKTRQLHTSRQFLSSPTETMLSSSANGFEKYDLENIKAATMEAMYQGNFEKAKDDLIAYSKHVPDLMNGGWRQLLLNSLKTFIRRIPEDQAQGHLSLPSNGSTPTSFLSCFKSAMASFPTQYDIESKIWLHCLARDLKHPHYTLHRLRGLLHDLQGYGVALSAESFMALLRSTIQWRDGPSSEIGLSPAVIELTLDILKLMQEQGLEILTEDMLTELQELVAQHPSEEPWMKDVVARNVFDLPCNPTPKILQRLHVLMMQMALPPFSDESRMRLLIIHAQSAHWNEFFDVFRMAPRHGGTNSPASYSFMFACVANSGNQKGCMTVLRNWTSDMDAETPPIKLEGEVGDAVKACLRVADPKVEQDALDPALKGEWLTIWRRCYPLPEYKTV